MLLKNNTMKLSICSMLTALCTVMMLCTGLMPFATYALPATAGILMIIAVIEIGTNWALLIYVASSILSLLLAADKQAVTIYILFFGYYPIVKAVVERLKKGKYVTMLLKAAVFNFAMVLNFYVTIYLLAVPKDSFTLFGLYLPWALLAVVNLVFFLYDYSVSCIVLAYWQRLHPVVKKWFQPK